MNSTGLGFLKTFCCQHRRRLLSEVSNSDSRESQFHFRGHFGPVWTTFYPPHRGKLPKTVIKGIAILCSTTPFLTGSLSSCGKESSSHKSNPVRPVHKVSFLGEGVDLDYQGSRLALSAKNSGVTVFDVSAPSRPESLGFVALEGVHKTLVGDEALYSFDEFFGLYRVPLVDFDQLSLTQALSAVELYGYVNDALWIDGSLTMTSEAIGLSQYTVNQDLNLVGGALQANSPGGQGTTSLVLKGDLLVAASYRGEMVTYRTPLQEENSLDQRVMTNHKINQIDCGTHYCYGASLAEGFHIYRVKKGHPIDLVGQIKTSKAVERIMVDNDLLYVATRGVRDGFGWSVYDLADPLKPTLVKKMLTGSRIQDFAGVGGYIYVLLEQNELQIFNRKSFK